MKYYESLEDFADYMRVAHHGWANFELSLALVSSVGKHRGLSFICNLRIPNLTDYYRSFINERLDQSYRLENGLLICGGVKLKIIRILGEFITRGKIDSAVIFKLDPYKLQLGYHEII